MEFASGALGCIEVNRVSKIVQNDIHERVLSCVLDNVAFDVMPQTHPVAVFVYDGVVRHIESSLLELTERGNV